MAEIFLLPGFGIAGISGFVSLIASVVLAYMKLTPMYPYAGHIALAAVIIVSALAVYAIIKSHAIEKMGLDTTIDSSVSMPEPGARMEEMNHQS